MDNRSLVAWRKGTRGCDWPSAVGWVDHSPSGGESLSPLAFPASEAGWEIQQGFSTHEALMQGLMHGVEGIRTSAEGVDGPQLRNLLKEVHPEMVALHVDGYDTVGALRAVVAWAGGVDVKGSSTWDVGRSCAFDEEALALHAEAWHAAMPAFQVWGVDAAKWQDRGMLPVDALGAMMSAAKAGLKVLLERGWSLESAAKHATMRVAMGTDVLSSVAMVPRGAGHVAPIAERDGMSECRCIALGGPNLHPRAARRRRTRCVVVQHRRGLRGRCGWSGWVGSPSPRFQVARPA